MYFSNRHSYPEPAGPGRGYYGMLFWTVFVWKKHMASERERLSTIKIVVFYIIVSVTFLFGQAVPTYTYDQMCFTIHSRNQINSNSRSNWNLELHFLEMLVLEERGKPEYLEKNLSEQSREPTNSAHI